ncbi:MAG TPA: hypothetical protein VFA33_07580 [Bryobacteraceae bacterium]|nr:hypothetical protein [Bryobacteraceae bacterium]
MTSIDMTQLALEVLDREPATVPQITQVACEVVDHPPGNQARITQVCLEVLFPASVSRPVNSNVAF